MVGIKSTKSIYESIPNKSLYFASGVHHLKRLGTFFGGYGCER